MHPYPVLVALSMLVTSFYVKPTYAQTSVFCTERAKEAKTSGRDGLAFAPSDIEAIVAKISSSMALNRAVSIVPCDELEKGRLAEVPPTSVVGGDYIAIDTVSLRRVLNGDSPEEAQFIVAHELAHILNSDWSDQRSEVSRKEKEDQADLFGVCVVARLEGDWGRLKSFLTRVRSIPSRDYSLFVDVSDALKKQFDYCIGSIAMPINNKTNDEQSKLPYLLDGLVNIIREKEYQAIAILRNPSLAALNKNARLRNQIVPVERAGSRMLFEAALKTILFRLDARSLQTNYPIPAPSVKELSFQTNYDAHSGARDISPYNYLRGCSWPERGTLLSFFRTWAEAQLFYKSVTSWLYGADDPTFSDNWWREFPPSSGLRGLNGFGNVRDQARTELMLDGLLRTGIASQNYEVLYSAIDRLDHNWRARIAEGASIMLEYDQLLDEHPEILEGTRNAARENPNSTLPEVPNPFGCSPLHDVNGSMTVVISDEPVKIEIDAGSSIIGLHNIVLSFWERRRKRGSAKEMRELLNLVVRDFSGHYSDHHQLEVLAFPN